MLRRIGLMSLSRLHQPATMQHAQRLLHGALGQSNLSCDVAVTHTHARLLRAERPPPEKQVHKERRWRPIMPRQVAQQHVYYICVKAEEFGSCHSNYYSMR